MIIVDSSVWIDYFNGTDTPNVNTLNTLLGAEPLAIGDLILVEVLQGFRQEADYHTDQTLLTSLTVFNLLGTDTTLTHRSAHNVCRLRQHGITIRKTIDVIIATFCIEQKYPLLFSGRDFLPFVQHLGLEAI